MSEICTFPGIDRSDRTKETFSRQNYQKSVVRVYNTTDLYKECQDSQILLIVYCQPLTQQNKMNNQFNYPYQATVGQLFDKAVDKMMNDQKFKSSMEQKSNYNSWSSSASGSQVKHFLCRIRIKMSFLLFPGIPNKFILNQTKRRQQKENISLLNDSKPITSRF